MQQGPGGDSFSPRAANEEIEENDIKGAKIAVLTTMAAMWINGEKFGFSTP